MADIILELTVPEAYTTRVLEALEWAAGKQLNIDIHGENTHGNWSYSYPVRQVGENARDFAARAIRQNILAMVRMADHAQDSERYRAEVSAITPPSQDVPDDIII